MDVLLRVEGLSKRFPGVWANQDISLEIEEGEIHCLLGENGAGKTTLSECLYGTYRPDAGRIVLRGRPLELSSPRDAIQAGIGMVHQHFVLAERLSVIENVVVGTPLRTIPDMRQVKRKVARLCEDYGVELELDATIRQLSVGQQQWVEILKALYVGVDLLILDEPTAALTPLEAEKLFVILEKMRRQRISVIFITHKLDEVMHVSDRVTVLRKGRLISTVDTSETSKVDLARLMVGRDVELRVDREPADLGEPVLELIEVRAEGDRGEEALKGVSVRVRRGEIMGLAGVSGNGQRELFEAVMGLRTVLAGRIQLDGQDITNLTPHAVSERGLACIPEDRLYEGLITDLRIDENLILGLHRDRPFSRWGVLRDAAIAQFAEECIRNFTIAATSARHSARVLSGGNLQKVILARELAHEPACLLASQPTRGLDVGATEYVYQRLLDQRRRGAGILLISEDLDEVFNLSDTIAVMYKGSIVGVLDADAASLDSIGPLMAGLSKEDVTQHVDD